MQCWPHQDASQRPDLPHLLCRRPSNADFSPKIIGILKEIFIWIVYTDTTMDLNQKKWICRCENGRLPIHSHNMTERFTIFDNLKRPHHSLMVNKVVKPKTILQFGDGVYHLFLDYSSYRTYLKITDNSEPSEFWVPTFQTNLLMGIHLLLLESTCCLAEICLGRVSKYIDK